MDGSGFGGDFGFACGLTLVPFDCALLLCRCSYYYTELWLRCMEAAVEVLVLAAGTGGDGGYNVLG
jgi:hypothetical protein